MLVEHGDADVVLAGGAESMSNYPYLLRGARWGMRMGVAEGMLEDALTTALCEPVSGPSQHICITAENIARRYGYTREQIDAYALESQRRARAAIEAGRFREQIVPVEVRRKKEAFSFCVDEHPRETSMEKLAALKPLLGPDGLITAGNASGVNDAAAAVVVMSDERAKALSLLPLARVVDFATAGVDPAYMGPRPDRFDAGAREKDGLGARRFRCRGAERGVRPTGDGLRPVAGDGSGEGQSQRFGHFAWPSHRRDGRGDRRQAPCGNAASRRAPWAGGALHRRWSGA